jgi:hypothetical protein
VIRELKIGLWIAESMILDNLHNNFHNMFKTIHAKFKDDIAEIVNISDDQKMVLLKQSALSNFINEVIDDGYYILGYDGLIINNQ